MAIGENNLYEVFSDYSLFASRARDLNSMLISDSTIAPQKAGQNPRTTKSGASSVDANISISALMTHQKSPRVRKVKGKVMSLQQQSQRGVHQPDHQRCDQRRLKSLHVKSGHNFDTISRLIALNSQFSSNRILFLSR